MALRGRRQRTGWQFVAGAAAPIQAAAEPTAAQLEHWFEHMVVAAAPCVQAHGIPVDDPSSAETWISGYRAGGSGLWHPFDHIRDVDSQEREQIEEDCPIMPDDFYELATPHDGS